MTDNYANALKSLNDDLGELLSDPKVDGPRVSDLAETLRKMDPGKLSAVVRALEEQSEKERLRHMPAEDWVDRYRAYLSAELAETHRRIAFPDQRAGQSAEFLAGVARGLLAARMQFDQDEEKARKARNPGLSTRELV